MAYLVELDIDEYGYLTGKGEAADRELLDHDWLTPFPEVESTIAFEWVPGEARRRPNVFAHNWLRDFVADGHAVDALRAACESDIRVIGRGKCDEALLSWVQVVTVLDVVDEEKSIRSVHSWGGIEFPHISDESEGVVSKRMFRVPDKGQALNFFIGNDVHEKIVAAGITGLRFTPAHVGE